MKLAIYTPSHDFEHLAETARSVERAAEAFSGETVWLLMLNGGRTPEELPAEIRSSPIVRICFSELKGVGALKAQAVRFALSHNPDGLVELDHDDCLTVNSLEVLAPVLERNGFAASDTATQTRFGAAFGWQAESMVVGGHRLWVNRTPEVSARSLCEIYHAPNHVRAWTRAAYEKTGGYDEGLPVCDDHDLLCKTYLAGFKMPIIREPLYIQREHERQTQLRQNGEIQTAQAAVGGRYLYRLVLEEANRRGLQAIDLGGAHDCPPGYQSLDLVDADILCDVRNGLPFPSHSVGVLRAHDFLEHLEPGDIVPFMNEAYRVLAPGGWLLTHTPSTDGRGAWQDPTHRSGWNSNSWWYYTRAEQAQYVPEIKCRFQTVRVTNAYPSKWHEQHLITYCDAALWCLKDQPTMGLVEI
jgi:predicted SAM-dependent methyltransferase